ncbi:MAG: hypothetical protein H6613_15450 [Ignavibacteriales bacterium]|nr:hypothetical protein [Ignavibacteriales bacterium]
MFLNFGSDADKNIDIIIKAISDLFDASCATYVKKIIKFCVHAVTSNIIARIIKQFT